MEGDNFRRFRYFLDEINGSRKDYNRNDQEYFYYLRRRGKSREYAQEQIDKEARLRMEAISVYRFGDVSQGYYDARNLVKPVEELRLLKKAIDKHQAKLKTPQPQPTHTQRIKQKLTIPSASYYIK